MTKPVNRPHKKKGRALKQPPADAAARIQALASDGFSVRGVAADLGTCGDTLRRWFDENPELRGAFEQGREQERHTLHNMLYRQAMEKGNATAAMFLLKARHGYREGDQGETGNRVSITFTLPGAMSMQEFKVIENEPNNRDERVSEKGLVIARAG